jgi:RNA polymerase sigma factor (sigma-70 family)
MEADMAKPPLDTVVRHLRRVTTAPPGPVPTDAELLERFVRQGDAAAFELLVWRHQRLVFGVCRRVLRDLNDAEDAFQATFLALVRKAGSISKHQALAGWLYQVAYRTACRASADVARRRAQPLGEVAAAPADLDDLGPLLDREVQRLPAKYREPLILCYLEGKTYDEAARQLGWPKGTLSTRLTRARELMRAQLTRRGLALSAAALATALGEQAANAAAPGTLIAATVQAILPGGDVSPTVAALTQGVLQAMFWTKVKIALGVTLTLAVLATAGALLLPSLAPTAQAARQEIRKEDPPAQRDQDWQLRATWKAAGEVTALAISPDGKRVAAGGGDQPPVRQWDLETGAERTTLQVGLRLLKTLTFAADGKSLIIGGGHDGGGSAVLVDLQAGKVLYRFQAETTVLYAQTSADAKHLVTINGAGKLHLFDIPTGKELRTVLLMEGPNPWVAVAPTMKMVALAKIGGGGIVLVDPNTGNVVRLFKGFDGEVGPLAFSQDGKALAAAIGPKGKLTSHVLVWDSTNEKKLVTLKTDQGAVLGVAFSPDGKTLATAGRDNTIGLWDAATGKQITLLRGHDAPVTAVLFSPDGRVLISGGSDRTVRLWGLGKADAAPKAEQPAVVGDRLAMLVKTLVKLQKTDAQIIEALCLATLARLPTEVEMQVMAKHVAGRKDREEAFTDVLWALTNSQEFHTNVEALRKQDPRQDKK